MNWHYFRISLFILNESMKMKTAYTILAAAAVGFAAFYILRRLESKKMRQRVASEGFETATDILYPNRRRSFSKYRIGPVLPS
jgi:hypothetical protein